LRCFVDIVYGPLFAVFFSHTKPDPVTFLYNLIESSLVLVIFLVQKASILDFVCSFAQYSKIEKHFKSERMATIIFFSAHI